jgi:hypothetical protein
MPAPSVSYTLVNGTANDAGQVNTNFTDLVNALTDGLKDLTVGSLTLNSAINLVSTLKPTNVTYSLGDSTHRFTTLALGTNLAIAAAPNTNTLYPNNMIKAAGLLTLGAAGAVTVTNGFNIASASYSGSTLTVTFHTNMASADYAVFGNFNVTSVAPKAPWLSPLTTAASNFTVEMRSSASPSAGETYAAGHICNVWVWATQ